MIHGYIPNVALLKRSNHLISHPLWVGQYESWMSEPGQITEPDLIDTWKILVEVGKFKWTKNMKLPWFFPSSIWIFQLYKSLSNFSSSFLRSARTFQLRSRLSNFPFFQRSFSTTCIPRGFKGQGRRGRRRPEEPCLGPV